MDLDQVVIVGGGLAGATAAASLRTRGFDGGITLIGAEPRLPYERPGLSKEYLRGDEPAEALAAKPDEFYAEQRIDVRTAVTVAGVRPRERSIVLGDGAVLRYDRLLLATGSEPRRLGVPGDRLDGVHLLRTIDDADAIRAAAASAEHVVVVGGGWIGAEVAASLRQTGRDVALVAPGSMPLERVLGVEVGRTYADLHAQHGVRLLMDRLVTAIRGGSRVEAVAFADGTSVPADLVVVGVGASPRTQLAVEAGTAVGDGVEVDEYLETSVPGIFAAGDIASAWHPLLERRIRVEHWDNAKRQGAAAAASILGERVPYQRLPYFFSDQFDRSMEYTGFAPAWDRVVFRGDLKSGSFCAFWLTEGRPMAAMKVNSDASMKALTALVTARAVVDVARLADPDVPFDAVVASAGAAEIAA